LSLAGAKAFSVTVLDLIVLWVAYEVSLALKVARAGPAVALDSELAAIASVLVG
jgi:hypothetical protein